MSDIFNSLPHSLASDIAAAPRATICGRGATTSVCSLTLFTDSTHAWHRASLRYRLYVARHCVSVERSMLVASTSVSSAFEEYRCCSVLGSPCQ